MRPIKSGVYGCFTPAKLELITLVTIGFLIYWFLKFLWTTFQDLQAEVAAAIIAAVMTVIISVLSITIGKFYERKLQIEQELRDKKIPIYEKFIDFIFDLLMASKKKGKEITQGEMVDFFSAFTKALLVWGSDEVIVKWAKYRKYLTQNNGQDKIKGMFYLEEILLAIRKDIGHKNKEMSEGDLLSLFINDIDKYTKKSSK